VEFDPGQRVWDGAWSWSDLSLALLIELALIGLGLFLVFRPGAKRVLGLLSLAAGAFWYSQVLRFVWRDGIQDGSGPLGSYPQSVVRLVLVGTSTIVAAYSYVLVRHFRRAA